MSQIQETFDSTYSPDELIYNIDMYKMIYKTNGFYEKRDQQINSSALVIVPKNFTGDMPVLFVMRGTNVDNAGAPYSSSRKSSQYSIS